MTRRTGMFGKRYNRSGRSTYSRPEPAPQQIPRPAPQQIPRPAPQQIQQDGDLKVYLLKSLTELNIPTNNIFAIQFFQWGWNKVLEAGMIQGPALAVNNSPDVPTQKALQLARNFQASMPKSWKYYVNKAAAPKKF